MITHDNPNQMYLVESYFTNDVGEFEIFPKYIEGDTYAKDLDNAGIEEATDKGFLINYTGTFVEVKPFTFFPSGGSAIFKPTISLGFTGGSSTWNMAIAKWKGGYVFTGGNFANNAYTRLFHYNFNGLSFIIEHSEDAWCVGTYNGRICYGTQYGKLVTGNDNPATLIRDVFDTTIGVGVEKAQEFNVTSDKIVQLLETNSALFILTEIGEIHVMQGSFANETIQITKLGKLDLYTANFQTLSEHNGNVYASTRVGLKKLTRNVNLTAFEITNENLDGINYYKDDNFTISSMTFIPKLALFRIHDELAENNILVNANNFKYSSCDGQDIVPSGGIVRYHKEYAFKIGVNEITFYSLVLPQISIRTGYLVYSTKTAQEKKVYNKSLEIIYKNDKTDTIEVYSKSNKTVKLVFSINTVPASYSGAYTDIWDKGNNIVFKAVPVGIFATSNQLIVKTIGGTKIMGIRQL